MRKTEEWRPVVGYEGYYEVSSLGRVRSIDRTTLVKRGNKTMLRNDRGVDISLSVGGAGYKVVNLCRGGKGKTYNVHSLVLESFSGSAPNQMECRHLDGVKTNNSIENLAWGTRKENSEDTIKHGTRASGEKHGMSKLKSVEVEEMRRIRGHGITQSVLARIFMVDQSTVSLICSGKRWGKDES